MLSRGVYPVKPTTFDLMRVWAAVTGLLLAVWFFADTYMGAKPSDLLPMLVAGIGGFELFLCIQDAVLKRQRRHG